MDYFEILPDETLIRVLSYLSFEEIDNLRSVNKKFKSACNHLLTPNYHYLKKHVALCNEKTRSLLISDQLSPTFPSVVSRQNYINRIFWFAVSEFLGNSFCLFDPLKGYLDKEYSVNGKTLDVVRQILWLKEVDDPLSHLVEMMTGRSWRHENLKCFIDCKVVYFAWFYFKHFRGKRFNEIYEPMLDSKLPSLDLPKAFACDKNCCYSLALDLLTTLWTEKLNIKQHRVHFSPIYCTCTPYVVKVKPVFKLGQNTDPQFYKDQDFDLEELGLRAFFEGHTVALAHQNGCYLSHG